MKYFIFAIALAFNLTLARAENRSINCSNASGTIQQIESEIHLKTVTLAGPQLIVLQAKDLNLKLGLRKNFQSSTQKISTFCGIPIKTVSTTYVHSITFSKKDGTPIINDDTPGSSPKLITATVLCEERVTDEWPCED